VKVREVVTEKFVGIDVSKATLDVPIDTDKTLLRVDDDEAGLARIVACLREVSPTWGGMETTGGLEVRVATERARCGLPVAGANPRQVRDFARAKDCLAKTDRVDVILLASAFVIEPWLAPGNIVIQLNK
jgi:transposase